MSKASKSKETTIEIMKAVKKAKNKTLMEQKVAAADKAAEIIAEHPGKKATKAEKEAMMARKLAAAESLARIIGQKKSTVQKNKTSSKKSANKKTASKKSTGKKTTQKKKSVKKTSKKGQTAVERKLATLEKKITACKKAVEVAKNKLSEYKKTHKTTTKKQPAKKGSCTIKKQQQKKKSGKNVIRIRLSGGPAGQRSWGNWGYTKKEVEAKIRDELQTLTQHFQFIDSGRADFIVYPDDVSGPSESAQKAGGTAVKISKLENALKRRM